MSQPNLADVRFVTAHYETLQGLALVPGLALLAAYFFASTWAGDRFSPIVWLAGGVVLIPLALLAGRWITRWYQRTYGDLAPRKTNHLGAVLSWVGGMIALGLAATMAPESTVSWPAIVVGVGALVLGGWVRRPLAPVLLPAGALLAVAGLLPLGRWLDLSAHPLSHISALMGVLTIVWLITALHSHSVLARVLRPGA